MNELINNYLTALNDIGRGFCSYTVGIFIQSSILIVLLLLIDFLLRRRVRAVFRYCVWMLVFVKLVLPPSLCLPTGIGYWFGNYLSTDSPVLERPTNVVQLESVSASAPEDSALSIETSQVDPSRTIPATAGPVTSTVSSLPPLTWQAIVFLFWLAGVVIFSVLLIERILFVRGLIGQREPANDRLLDVLNECRRQVGIRRNIALRLSNNVSSPAVCGLSKPTILVPTALIEKLPPDELRAVLIHELAHIKRGDLWVNSMQTFLQIIYFYNPFVWLANAVVRRIREQAVDEMVLVALGAGAKSYSNTLIDIAEMAFFRANLGLSLISVAESKKSLERRVKHMLTRPIPKSAKVGVAGLLIVVIAGAILLPMAAVKAGKKDEPRFMATLPDGVTIELVGVCEFPSEGKKWWKPDGTELSKKIRVRTRGRVSASGIPYTVAVKVTMPEDATFEPGRIKGATGRLSLEVVDSEGRPISNMWAWMVYIDEKLTATSIQLGAAAGPWKTKARNRSKGRMSTAGIVFSKAYESDGGVRIIVADEHLDLDYRIAAIDTQGKEHLFHQRGGSAGKVRQTTAVFHDIKLNQIENFLFQTRLYQWATFRNVSLRPNVRTDVQVEVENRKQINSHPEQNQHSLSGKSLLQLIDSAQPGSTVIVPKGLYKEPIQINKSLTLKGESRTECIFEVTANKPAILVDTKGKGKVVVQDLTIKWQLGTSDKGIERPFALGVKDTKAEVKNCSFVPLGDLRRSPVAIRAEGFSELNISSCRFKGFEYVICYGPGTKGKAENCLIMDCGHQGVINYSGSTLRVERNVITGSGFHAVRSTGGTLYVKDNLIINNKNRGIYLGNKSAQGTITNNVIVDNGTGIGGFARSRFEISNNIIADGSYAGIGVYQSCNLRIRDNIFMGNERGWIMFEKGNKGGNTVYRNTFWQNKVDAENLKKTANSIEADPSFVDPENGDFSLKSGPAKEHNQGLTNPQIFKTLWKVWKNRKDKNEPFITEIQWAQKTGVQVEVEKPNVLQVPSDKYPTMRSAVDAANNGDKIVIKPPLKDWDVSEQNKAEIPPTSYINEQGRIVDKTDYPFANDPKVIGGWKTVDFVRGIDEFDPTEKSWEGDLYLNHLIFEEGGKIAGNILTWTKGLVLSDDTASKYIIREVDGSTYMFFEWKSGDYTIRHMRPHYYVLRKVLTESLKYEPMFGKKAYIPPTSTINEQGRIVDKTDYPFVNDRRVIGTWKSVDFVGEIEEFKAGEKQWEGRELYLKELIFLPNGRTFKPWLTWTRGLVFHSGDKTASKYTIKDIEGSAYMFFEWKSGDYILRYRKPSYYVLRKVSSETRGLAEGWAFQPSDAEFARQLPAKIKQLDIDTADLERVKEIFGKPAQYIWGKGTFKEDSLPRRYILVYPSSFNIYMRENKIVELRHESGFNYVFRDKLRSGSTLDEVFEVIGYPKRIVQGEKNLFEDGVLYKDIDGRKGHCYYARHDQNVRLWFLDYKIIAIYMTRSDYGS